MANNTSTPKDEKPNKQQLHRRAVVLPHLPDIQLSTTVVDSPEGPAGDGNGRSPSASQRRDAPVTEDAADSPNQQPNEQAGPNEDLRLLTAGEVAQLLAVPESWVREATRAGRLPHLTLGRYRRYFRPAIKAWLQDQQAGPRPSLRPANRPDLRHRSDSSL
jgi:excisionase family DNA binding protein